MFKLEETRHLQLEISNYCNSACPQCPRNYQGGNTILDLPLKNWSLLEFQHVINQFDKKQLELIYFCGTFGDPMMNPHIVKMCETVKTSMPTCKIGIHTNGGLQYKGVYKKLAKLVDFCAFGIDGLEDTNHLYRRKVNWSKVIENTTEFIKNGGKAYWDFIVFEHNQHQVESAKQMSIDLGFRQFNIKKTSRFLNYQHNYAESIEVLNKDNQVEYEIKIPTDQTYINNDYKNVQSLNINDYVKYSQVSCNSCRIKEIYVGCEGLVFPCGWLHDRMYGSGAKHIDHLTLSNLFDQIGGQDNANIFKTNLHTIVDQIWFPLIALQWDKKTLHRCAIMCGNKFNLIGPQNSDITYKK